MYKWLLPVILVLLATQAFSIRPGTGLTINMYKGINFDELKGTRIDQMINYPGNAPIDALIGNENFSVRWTGMIMPKFTEKYTFTTISDDGIRVTVDGQKLIDNWTGHGATPNSGDVQLKANKMVPITVEFFQGGGGWTLQLFWQSQSQAKEIVPTSVLYPTFKKAGVDYACQSSADISKSSITIPNQTGEIETVIEKAADCALNSDGSLIVYTWTGRTEVTPKNTEIVVSASDGSSPIRLTRNKSEDCQPSFSPDDQWILFISNRDGNKEIYVMKADCGTDQTRLTNTPGEEAWPVFTPDNKRILFQSTRNKETNIFIINGDGTGEEQITKNGGMNPVMTLDGKTIFFTNIINGKSYIYKMNANGTEISRLTANEDEEYRPVVTAKGQKVIFTIKNAEGKHNIASYEFATGKTTILTTTGNYYMVTASADGGKE
jgi:hypothetical protein